ncbi:Mur ligase family protein [Bacillus licheniformis]|nr:Mur ligase family protein [Bacillus licheniformis]
MGESHLLELGSREGIAEAKLEIVNGLSKEGTLIMSEMNRCSPKG